jgi:hypothetical protein
MSVAVPSEADHDELVTVVKQLAGELNQLREENDQLREENEELREELADERDRTARELAQVRTRVTELEESVEKSPDTAETEGVEPGSSRSDPEGQTPDPTVPDPETALEDTLRLPDGVAEDSLSANQLRARSVARDIRDYAEFNHQYGNYSLTAKRLRIVLKAHSDDNTAHHETVKRVRKFLNRLGETEVTMTEDRGGTKRLVFAESLVDRIEAYQNHAGVQHETMGAGVKS